MLPAVCLSVLCAALIATAAMRSDQPLTDSVGIIEGESISVTGPMSVEIIQGQVRTVLRSGGDVRVRSGTARIDLVEGGQISICGPPHLSVLKSGGWLPLALHTGTLHRRLEDHPARNIYTPHIHAQMDGDGDGAPD